MILNELISNHPLEDFAKSKGVELTVFEYPEREYLKISGIFIPKENRKQGLGSEVMQQVVDYADENGLTVILTPSTDFGATSVARLRKFYGRFGFKRNFGRNKDYRYSEAMIRLPK